MQTILVFSLFFASCLCYPGWGNQQQGGYSPSRGIPRQAQGGWGGQQGGSPGAGWGAKSFGAQGKGPGAGGAWGQQAQAGGWRGGRSADEDGQYGATIIDTPDMYGYEATIPGAHSKFIGYRGARSGPGGLGRAYDQQGPQGQGQGSNGHRPWSQGGHQY